MPITIALALSTNAFFDRPSKADPQGLEWPCQGHLALWQLWDAHGCMIVDRLMLYVGGQGGMIGAIGSSAG